MVPWTARRSNQCILKEISPGISLEGMMLKLKLQYFGHLMQRVDSLEKTLMLGGRDWGQEKGTTEDEMVGWAPKSLQMVTAVMKLKTLAPWKKSYDQPRQHIKKQRHYFANKGPSSQSYGFSGSHVWM